MKVALYARYSSNDQRDASIEDQLRLCRARADREGWKIVDSYTDRAISGASLLRPAASSTMNCMSASWSGIGCATSRTPTRVSAFRGLTRRASGSYRTFPNCASLSRMCGRPRRNASAGLPMSRRRKPGRTPERAPTAEASVRPPRQVRLLRLGATP